MTRQNKLIEPYFYNENLDDARFLRDAKKILGKPMESVEVKDLAAALAGFQKGWAVSNLSLLPLIREHSKSPEDSPKENLQIQKDFINTRGFASIGRSEMYFDVPYQFVLRDNNSAYANTGFEPYEGGILVSQLQGIRGKQELLRKLAWPKLLLNFVEEWAYSVGIPEVSVLPSARNKWIKQHDLSQKERFKLIYDITARRNGYEYNPNTQVYTKPLIDRSLTEKEITEIFGEEEVTHGTSN